MAVWGISPQTTASLLLIPPPQTSARGKSGHGMKKSQQVVADFSRTYGRLRRWAEGVFTSEWSQAQLLQVMEEIESMVTEALTWMHMTAIASVGSYAYLGDLIGKFMKDEVQAHSLRLGLTSGLETPDGHLINALETGASSSEVRELFGHMALTNPCEIASPRIEEMAERLIGSQSPPESLVWGSSRAQERQEAAMKVAHSKAGLLGRSNMRKTVALTQEALVAHAKARDALAYVLAAARHWAKAAAQEGLTDGRIQEMDEIFMLEIEEIKQMMTGEWHSRAHVDPLILQRQESFQYQSEEPYFSDRSLGVAGQQTQGPLALLATPEEVEKPSGFIALAANWSPVWWRAILMAEGVIAPDGDLLSWVASVARMGDLPTLVGGAPYANWPAGATIRLDPARNRAQKLS